MSDSVARSHCQWDECRAIGLGRQCGDTQIVRFEGESAQPGWHLASGGVRLRPWAVDGEARGVSGPERVDRVERLLQELAMEVACGWAECQAAGAAHESERDGEEEVA